MFDNFINGIAKLFGSGSERALKKYQPIVEEIKSHEDELKALSDDELRGYTENFRKQLSEATQDIDRDIEEIKRKLNSTEDDETISIEERRRLTEELEALDKEWLDTIEDVLREIMPLAFAVLKDTCRRMVGKSWMVAGNEITWNMIPYDVQLIGAISLHEGKIAEMKTGEGKTLVSIFPAYLNSLVGRGVHMVTVNTYLAQRDAEWNAPVFEFHGIKVDCIDRYEPSTEDRRKAYRADITYGTNNEFGFDYLRDNMTQDPESLVQRGHHFTIVDEVDSVLIDEARTPLIISGPVPQDNQSQKYIEFKPRVQTLVEAQKKLIAKFLSEADQAMKEGDEKKAGFLLFRVQRGFPKSRKFQKMMQDPDIQRMVQQTEYFYLQDQGKNMGEVDEGMYYTVNYKQKVIEMTEMGRELITKTNEDSEFFVIPDIGLETSKIEEEQEAKFAEIEKELRENSNLDPEAREREIAKRKEDLRRKNQETKQELYKTYTERSERIHTVNNLLKAYTLFENDEEYIIQDEKVQIVDEHTGRVLPGRRYSDGLHQAIEAKEQVKVEASTQTYATVTLQNYFRMYHKLAGMTGTAATEEAEFHEIYKMDVVEIPTNRPIQRDDKNDLIFYTKREKYNAIIDKIKEYQEDKIPVLVGTTSVEVSETLSRVLKRSGIQHNVLNAKQHAHESQIVAEAGQPGAVTIATNMAGRGTDIKLGEGVREAGGLAIIGSERHDSRRIDLQLRGRAGRQGDPGESQFYVSLEDNLMKLFGSDRIVNVLGKLKHEEGEAIENSFLTKQLEKAQSKVEQNNFSIRKRQLEFDDVLNNQRTVIYKRRRNALLGDKITSDILDMLEDVIYKIVDEHYGNAEYENIQERLLRSLSVDVEIDREKWASLGPDGLTDLLFEKAIEHIRNKEKMVCDPFFRVIKDYAENPDIPNKPENVQIIFTDGIRRFRVIVNVDKAVETNGRELMNSLQRSAVLNTIDMKWMEHLRELDALKEGVGLRSFGQKDPLIEFKREAFNAFGQLLEDLNSETLSVIWKAMPEITPDRPLERASQQRSRYDKSRMKEQHSGVDGYGVNGGYTSNLSTNRTEDGEERKQQPVVVGKKIGRNDPCPLDGSKKFKHCCGASGSKTCTKVGEGVA